MIDLIVPITSKADENSILTDSDIQRGGKASRSLQPRFVSTVQVK